MYPGGKGSVYQKIINLIPPHSVYIEPFLGGGAVMKNKRPAAINIGLELDGEAIRATVEGIAPGAEIAKGDAAAASVFIAMQALTAKLSDSRRDLVVSPDPAGRAGPAWYFVCGDALEFLRAYPFRGHEFIYCDPPYLIDTRASARPIYSCEMTRDQHVALLEIVQALPCRVMLSGYESELYNSRLKDWHTHQYDAQTRGGSVAREWLWMNYPEPDQLHDYQYLGDDYRERERIKRKKDRWVNRFKSLEGLERKAILWAMRDAGIIP